MKRRYSLLCVFLCLCLLLPLFSVSANALTVDGYNTTNAWWYDDPQDYLIFSNQIVSSFDFDYITIQVDIELTSAIEAKSLFDFELVFSSSQYGILTVTKFQPLNTSRDILDTLQPMVVNNKLIVTDLQYKEDVKYIRVQFKVERPMWSSQNVETNILIGGISCKAQRNMRWSEWVNSSYNTLGLRLQDGKIYGSNVVLKFDGYIVNPNDFIVDNGVYTLDSLDSPSNKINFSINGIPYETTFGTTWEQFLIVEPVVVMGKDIFEDDPDDIYLYSYQGYPFWLYGDDSDTHVSVYDEIVDTGYYYYDTDDDTYGLVNYTFDFSLTSVSVEVQDEQGILNRIIKYFKDTINQIKDLPSKIGEIFSNISQRLLIPSESYLIEYSGRFEDLLRDRFGAVYESVDIIENFVSSFSYEKTQNLIKVPSVTINLSGVPFVFGGWDVEVVPAGFEGIVNTLKNIVSIVCTLAFLNGMRKRFEEVLKG